MAGEERSRENFSARPCHRVVSIPLRCPFAGREITACRHTDVGYRGGGGGGGRFGRDFAGNSDVERVQTLSEGSHRRTPPEYRDRGIGCYSVSRARFSSRPRSLSRPLCLSPSLSLSLSLVNESRRKRRTKMPAARSRRERKYTCIYRTRAVYVFAADIT